MIYKLHPMKTKLIALSLLLVGCIAWAGTIGTVTLTSPATVAASSTNSTAQTATDFTTGGYPIMGLTRVSFTFTGAAGSTNGTVTVFLSESSDGTRYSEADQSNMKITITPNGTNSVTRTERFDLSGVKKIRVGRVENTSGGDITNIVTSITYLP